MDSAVEAVQLCAVPATSMFLGSCAAFKLISSQSKGLLAITQFFSAGILIAAIGAELVPKLINSSTGWLGSVCVSIGFFTGVALMLGIEACIEDDDEDDEEDEKKESLVPAENKPAKRRSSITKCAKDLDSAEQCDATETTKAVAWGLTVPIFIDSWMDGLLIGVVLVASTHAAGIMALATTIEMGFLGITFGAMLKPCGWRKWPLALLAPVILVAGGGAGAVCADMLNANPAVFEGVVAFGASALLFLVTHELLTEASENMGKEDWHLSVWVFIGFLFVIISERIFPDNDPGAS